MFKKNTSRGSRFGKPSFGQRAGSGSSRGGFRGGNGGGRRGGGHKGQFIHASRFVCKAEPIAESAPYQPTHAFSDFAIDERIKKNIAQKGYVSPMPIQDQAIPHILNGSDFVGIANTGTGKTAAFLLPLLDKVLRQPEQKVLIIVPTRELATQINQEFYDFRGNLRLFSACCVGGTSIGQQIAALRRNPQFVIGTPGRLKDLLERKVFVPSQFGTIVLDEADRMLDMGFVGDMRMVMSKMAPNRQTLFFSATMTTEIVKLIGEFLREPITVSVKTGDTSKNIDQDVVRLQSGQEKFDVLHSLLAQPEFNKVLIFGRTKFGVEKLSQALIKKGHRAEAIHGNKTQSHRERALRAFRENHSRILVATDVAARGLDIPNVSHVINYDVPSTYEDYVHRIGRTGRGGQTGKALTFID